MTKRADVDAAYVTGEMFEVDGGSLVQGRAPMGELQPVATPENLNLTDVSR